MARLIKNTQKAVLGIRLTTIMETGAVVREFKTGDIVEGLRYVKNGEIETVSGRLADIKYTMAVRSIWNKKDPRDTLPEDMTVNTVVIDTSERYKAKTVEVPVREIVEFAGETDVIRMRFEPFIVYDIELKYSDLVTKQASIQVGDTFDHVRLMNITGNGIGPDITGKFKVVAFSYSIVTGRIAINGIAFQDVEDGKTYVVNLEHILALDEVYNHAIDADSDITAIIAGLGDGDTLIISNEVTTVGSPVNINKQNITLDLQADLISDGGNTSGVRIENGSATLKGNGLVATETPYDRNHAAGVISVRDNGELIFNGSGVDAVIEDDPVNKGQFGVVVTGNGKITVNAGNFTTGWYCIAGNGSTTTADSVVEINGGEFKSVADYAIYHPDPGTLIINDGLIEGAAGALAANNGTIEINGGTFRVLGGGDTGNWSDGTSGLTDVAINLNARYGDIVCRITGGTFYATAAGTILIKTGTAHTVDLQISGGRFTSKPNAEWIAEGYVCTETADAEGFYHVTTA